MCRPMPYQIRKLWGCGLSLAAIFLMANSTLTAGFAASSQLVSTALGQEESFQTRLDAVHALTGKLSLTEAEAIFEGIVTPKQAQGLPLPQWAALYNDVFNAFNAMPESLEDYPKRLIELISQEERAPILRDYALQHLLAHLEFKNQGEAESREKILNEVEEWVIASPETTLSGTYLLSIWQLAGKPGYPSAEEIGKTALDIAADPEALAANRISAIQICGQLGYAPALPGAREIAANAELRTGLRAAAIATIGDLGDASEEDRKFLIRIKRWGQPRLQFAAQEALKEF